MVQYEERLDRTFAALADSTRRGILERLGKGDESISKLAGAFDMTLTGMKKHVGVLEEVGLVETKKVGRVRQCSLVPNRLEEVDAWIETYRQMIEARYDHLEVLLQSMKEDSDGNPD